MVKQKQPLENLTDEQILKEFVKRFKCDGAVLIYLDSGTENGLGRWRNSVGKEWVSRIFKLAKQGSSIMLSNPKNKIETNNTYSIN